MELFSHSKCNMLTWWKFKVAADMFCAGFFRGGVDGCEVGYPTALIHIIIISCISIILLSEVIVVVIFIPSSSWPGVHFT